MRLLAQVIILSVAVAGSAPATALARSSGGPGEPVAVTGISASPATLPSSGGAATVRFHVYDCLTRTVSISPAVDRARTVTCRRGIHGHGRWIAQRIRLPLNTSTAPRRYRITETGLRGRERSAQSAAVTVAGFSSSPPAATSGTARSVTPTSAVLTGSIDPYGATITECTFEYGEAGNLDRVAACTLGARRGSEIEVSASVVGLASEETVHFHVHVRTGSGEATSKDASFETPGSAQLAIGSEDLQPLSAAFRGDVNGAGAEITLCEVEYGTSVAYGTQRECSYEVGAGYTGPQLVQATTLELAPGTEYHYRLVVETSAGERLSTGDATFTTPPMTPTIKFGSLAAEGETNWQLSATADAMEQTVSTCEFEYWVKPEPSPPVERGEEEGPALSANFAPCSEPWPSGNGEQLVVAEIPGSELLPETTYEFDLVIEASSGGATASEKGSFTTEPAP